MNDVLALIPARSGSKGIADKNFRSLAGGPNCVTLAIGCARRAGIHTIVVSSDTADPENGDVLWLNRPPELAQDDTPMVEVVQHALAQVPGPPEQIIVLLQPTQPLRTPAHIQSGISLLRETGADSVVSVIAVPKEQSPELLCWILGLSGYLYPFNVKRGLYGRESRDWTQVIACRQDAAAWYRRDGTVYAFRRQTVSEYGTIYGGLVRPLIIPPEETCALDTEQDWREAERRLSPGGIVDYEGLLRKYMDHIGSCEGHDFLSDRKWSEFTEAEWAVLQRCRG